MTLADRWLLPEGIEELLPPDAARLEQLRRSLLDTYRSWGYEQVFPPLVEYLDSLLTGMGQDLAHQTFKLTDPLTGRQMGVRADMTPQIARIDAHSLKRDGVNRLCYAGHVLHAKPSSITAPRALIQIGAEVYGHAGVDADIEVVLLMLETLRIAGIERVHLDLGHMAIYRALAAAAALDHDAEWRLFDILQRKAVPELEQFLEAQVSDVAIASWFRALVRLAGNVSVLKTAREQLEGAPTAVFAALDELSCIADTVSARAPEAILYFDLGELRGYHYHTGAVFSAYVPGVGHAIASGGRYDQVGEVFGRARPATGFSTDLSRLVKLGMATVLSRPRRILAPAGTEPGLWQAVCELRAAGDIVEIALGSESVSAGFALVKQGDVWQVVANGGS